MSSFDIIRPLDDSTAAACRCKIQLNELISELEGLMSVHARLNRRYTIDELIEGGGWWDKHGTYTHLDAFATILKSLFGNFGWVENFRYNLSGKTDLEEGRNWFLKNFCRDNTNPSVDESFMNEVKEIMSFMNQVRDFENGIRAFLDSNTYFFSYYASGYNDYPLYEFFYKHIYPIKKLIDANS